MGGYYQESVGIDGGIIAGLGIIAKLWELRSWQKLGKTLENWIGVFRKGRQ
jgi:hypothetical protein